MDESDANRICILREMIDREDPWPDLGAPDVAFLLRIIGDLESEIDERDSRIIALQGQHEQKSRAFPWIYPWGRARSVVR